MSSPEVLLKRSTSIFEKILKVNQQAAIKITEQAEQRVLEAERKRIEAEEAEEAARVAEENRINRVDVPVRQDGWYITAEYSNVDHIHTVPHTGIDFGNGPSYGWQAYPVAKGEVISVNDPYYNGCGNWVAIYHADLDTTSIYCHLAYTSVNTGDWVDPDTPLGEIGNTGYSFGIHLHLGIFQGYGYRSEAHYNARDFFARYDITF